MRKERQFLQDLYRRRVFKVPFIELFQKHKDLRRELFQQYLKTEGKPDYDLFLNNYYTEKELEEGFTEVRRRMPLNRIGMASFVPQTDFESSLHDLKRKFEDLSNNNQVPEKFLKHSLEDSQILLELKDIANHIDDFKKIVLTGKKYDAKDFAENVIKAIIRRRKSISIPKVVDIILTAFLNEHENNHIEGQLIWDNGYQFRKRNGISYSEAKAYYRELKRYADNCISEYFESQHPWLNPFQKPKEQYYPMEQPKNISENPIESLPTIVILTAIQEEYDAVRQFLKEVVEVDQDDTTYEAGIFSLFDKDIAKVIIRECGAKNTIAAQETERAVNHFKPDAIFFVGIAGSRKPNDFSIGDVIFPREIYSYEAGKADKDKFMARPDLASSTYALAEIAKKERRKGEWKVLIKNGRDTNVKANLGIIASGEQLIEHYESEIGKILTEHYNDTSAIEMEGFGFAKAAMRQGRSSNHMMIGVVRGISDIIEQPSRKIKKSSTDRRPDNAKQLASDSAAAFAFWLIYKAFQ